MAVKYYNTYTKQIETEQVCSEGFLQFLYTNIVGKFILHALVKRKFFSKIFGIWADSKISKNAALKFIVNYSIDTREMLAPPASYKCFNDFFTRELKHTARPLSENINDVSTAADGRHLAFENISEATSIYAKGQKFSLRKFLDAEEFVQRFKGGSCIISRLCPTDYHRFHFPVSGKIVKQTEIDGALFSVSPIALSRRLEYFFENKRMLTLIELDSGKHCLMVEVGATNVGSIIQLKKVGDTVKRGECKGFFKFGGSCVATFFEKDILKINKAFLDISAEAIESFYKVNTTFAELV